MNSKSKQFINSFILLALGVVLTTAIGSAFAAGKIAARNGLDAADFQRLALIFSKTLWAKSIILEICLFLPVLALLAILRRAVGIPGLLLASSLPALVHLRYFSGETSLLRMKELGLHFDAFFYWIVFLVTLLAGAVGARRKSPGARTVSRWNPLSLAAVFAAVILLIVFFLMRSYSQPEAQEFSADKRDVRVIFIGLDGATWDVMEPMIERGELPSIAALMERGSYGPLKTLKPTLSPRIWTSIATGKRPRKHGIYGFFEYSLPGLSRNITYLPYRHWKKKQIIKGNISRVSSTSTSRRAAALWNILGAAGRTAGLVRWNTSWPPEDINGFIITHRAYFSLRREARENSGRLPAEITTHPHELAAEIAPLFSRPNEITKEEISSFIPVSDELWRDFQSKKQYEKGDKLSILKFIYNEDLFFNRVALHALDEHPTDFFALYFYGTDAIQHYFWKYHRPEDFSGVDAEELKIYGGLIENYYRFADSAIGEILERADERTVVAVVSDHGMESVRPEGSEGYRSGSHRRAPPGIFIFSGPGIQRKQIKRASVLNIAPTLLRIFGIPLADDFDGKPLDSILDLDVFPKKQRSVKTYDWLLKKTKLAKSGSEPEVKQRLKSLGYIK